MKDVELPIPIKLVYLENKPLIPNEKYEIKLLELIRYNQYGIDSTLMEITNHILNSTYQTEGIKYPFKEIETFFNFKEYINALSDKIDTVNMYILNKIDNPFVVDYYFLRWENDNAIYNVKLCGVEDVVADKKS